MTPYFWYAQLVWYAKRVWRRLEIVAGLWRVLDIGYGQAYRIGAGEHWDEVFVRGYLDARAPGITIGTLTVER